MERNASNNWGNKMTEGPGFRPECPKCEIPCEDDGDRYFDDVCFSCGWSSKSDLKGDKNV